MRIVNATVFQYNLFSEELWILIFSKFAFTQRIFEELFLALFGFIVYSVTTFFKYQPVTCISRTYNAFFSSTEV